MVSPSQTSNPPTTPPPQVAPAREPADHVPANPSRLRESHNISAEDMSISNPAESEQKEEPRSLGARIFDVFRGNPQQRGVTQSAPGSGGVEVLGTGQVHEATQLPPDARTRLLDSYNREFVCGTTDCGHGTFSPKASPSSGASSVSSFPGIGGDRFTGNTDNDPSDSQTDGTGEAQERDEERNMSTTKMLAKKHGVKNTRSM